MCFNVSIRLGSYLDNWLEFVGVNYFELFKELILKEQLKKRFIEVIREKYLSYWEEFKSAVSLVEKCDYFEKVRRAHSRTE